MLVAIHVYSPLSDLFAFVIVNCFLSDDKLILGLPLAFMGDPFMVHDNVGTGFPMVSHDKVSLSPSLIKEFHVKINKPGHICN